ncbi:hypothetical protein BT93_G1595 [Corymbia citriodora subsp. variegata]|nr:hypothetical protein BT93_G1595 [Corymbia citriodora subsp. variegata]KAF8021209.1 hypothetical protein BT93_G1595 [Corymbia citriodora subsp. variegata]
MATHPDPEPEFDSLMLPRLPPLKVQVEVAAGEGKAEAEAEECRTPTSEEHRIPPALTCPAAPRKPTARTRPTPAVPRKRALPPSDRLEFLEAASRGEVEGFFRSCNDAAKRRRFFFR